MTGSPEEKLRKLTVDDVMKFEPCYDREKLEEYLPPRRKALTILEIFELRNVSLDDRLWIGFKCVGKRIAVEIACEIARDVLPIFETEYPSDDRPRKAIEAVEKWLRDEIPVADVADAATHAATAYAAAHAANAAADAAYAAAYAAADAADVIAHAAYAAAYAVYAIAAAADAVYAADAVVNITEYKQACLGYLAMKILENEERRRRNGTEKINSR